MYISCLSSSESYLRKLRRSTLVIQNIRTSLVLLSQSDLAVLVNMERITNTVSFVKSCNASMRIS